MPGDYVEYTIGNQSVIVVRLDADTVARLPERVQASWERSRQGQRDVSKTARSPARFMAGVTTSTGPTRSSTARTVSRRDHGLAVLCLPQALSRPGGRASWINLDPDAPPLADALEPMPSLLDPLGID